MPIEPKKESGLWQIALEHVDDEPPVSREDKERRPMQLSFEPVRRTFSSMSAVKKQSFLITEDYAEKATTMSRKLQFPTKSDFLANVVANHLDLCDKMNEIR